MTMQRYSRCGRRGARFLCRARVSIVFATLGLLLGVLNSLNAQPFTYQGFLRDGGLPANGTYQMTFRIFSVPSGGTALATIGPVNVSVSNGLFTQELDFGTVWTGADRYLETQVGSTVLSPRVKINPTPYAGYSNATRGLNVDGNLNVGLTALRRTIGFNPADSFGYDGKRMGHYALGWFDDSWNSSGGTAWLSGFAGIKLFTLGTPRLVVNQAGKVGIGTSGPAYLLHVETGVGDRAIYGLHTATSGTAYGVYGLSASTAGTGVFGWATATSGTSSGVRGQSDSIDGRGVFGWTNASSGTTYGVYGQSDSSRGTGVYGLATANSGNTYGVYGESASTWGRGVVGWAYANSGNTYGVWGGSNSPSGYGVYSYGNFGVAGTKSFQMDHPLRPETHYLNHFCTEGPEPYNAYRGNVVTDANGYATITLPPHFESINRDSTYHLTVIDNSDDFVLAKVVRKIQNNQFVIRTNKPFVEVSWEVKAIRNDRWVQEYGYQTEQPKPAEHRGKYLNPELYGQPKELGIHYHPEPEREGGKLE